MVWPLHVQSYLQNPLEENSIDLNEIQGSMEAITPSWLQPNWRVCPMLSRFRANWPSSPAVCLWEVWYKVLRRCGWQTLSPAPHDHFTEWWLRSRKRVVKPHRRAFGSLTICVVWSLWLKRNERVFRQSSSNPARLVDNIWALIELWSRAKLVELQLEHE
jgi:hypothetical protein